MGNIIPSIYLLFVRACVRACVVVGPYLLGVRCGYMTSGHFGQLVIKGASLYQWVLGHREDQLTGPSGPWAPS